MYKDYNPVFDSQTKQSTVEMPILTGGPTVPFRFDK